jgi:hypothetical protein
MYKFFMVIHSIVENNSQDEFNKKEEKHINKEYGIAQDEEEEDEQERSNNVARKSKFYRTFENLVKLAQKSQNRDINTKQFDYIYKNKIRPDLETEGQMKFHELNLILTAYEFYQYEKKSGDTLQKLNDN